MLTTTQCNKLISIHIVHATNVVGYFTPDVAKYILHLSNPYAIPQGGDIKMVTSTIENAGGTQKWMVK